MSQGGNLWALFTPGIWKDLHAVLHNKTLRTELGWPEEQYDDAKAELLASESVRKVFQLLHSLRNMSRMDARRRKASAVRLRFSKSLASLRQRPNQPRLRSTTQRFGIISNPLAVSDRFTISTSMSGIARAAAAAKTGPW